MLFDAWWLAEPRATRRVGHHNLSDFAQHADRRREAPAQELQRASWT
jgi:hypothetical protein